MLHADAAQSSAIRPAMSSVFVRVALACAATDLAVGHGQPEPWHRDAEQDLAAREKAVHPGNLPGLGKMQAELRRGRTSPQQESSQSVKREPLKLPAEVSSTAQLLTGSQNNSTASKPLGKPEKEAKELQAEDKELRKEREELQQEWAF